MDENLKSLQHLMEDQIYRLLRKCRVITNVWYTPVLFRFKSKITGIYVDII